MRQPLENRSISGARRPWVSTATSDAIRHFAWGIGDNNPLWTDVEHARSSRWGRVIAPPCFLYGVDETTVAHDYLDHRRLYRSVDWTFLDVVPVGSVLQAAAWQIGEHETGGVVEQVGRVEFRIAGAGLVACAETRCLRSSQSSTVVEDRPELRYSGEQLEAIERAILSEVRRGEENRNWEDVSVGDALGPLLKGPLSIMDVVAWSAATSGVVDDDCGHSEGGLNEQSATGPEQVAWIGQLLTDWMGDDAFLHRLSVVIDVCPVLGTTTAMEGQVTAVEVVSGRPTAHIRLTATSQEGESLASGTAQVLLPSIEYGPVRLPLEE